MGSGRCPSKIYVAKEIQRLISDESEQQKVAKIAGLLWVFRGGPWAALEDDAVELIDLAKN